MNSMLHYNILGSSSTRKVYGLKMIKGLGD